ncbi:bifunctional non-homologous end joining protein LigD [Actinomadura meyerae]|uniref:Bifunctional non-homologous end joining protein LigD n=1 Tax=Actinomadura meyerae TaxID=240840 RepID=A0A239HJ84_9ACTN|nr:non-homologous end-joining DNA ligase [Actinomadura meyerae]SNS81459.1 bifunctional non-homologous end joining protein LigD [Actinomadura meyerae]
MSGEKTTVEVDGRQLSLSNLDKTLYPEFTKGEVIDYYARIAPVMLPHLKDRAATRIRWPDGVDGGKFYEKNAPSHTPDWIRTATVPSPGSTRGRETVDYIVVDDLPTLVWCANLAALELHIPQWKVGPRGKVHAPDLLVFDLDPGPPATVIEACKVALLLEELLGEDGLEAYPKTSGKKGLHIYVPVKEPKEAEQTSRYAKGIAERLAMEHPDLVVAKMEKRLRKGKVFVDWSQNNPAKTTVAPYSLRAASRPSVSTPVTWDELEYCEDAADLVFSPAEVLDRVDEHGDLLEPILKDHRPLP